MEPEQPTSSFDAASGGGTINWVGKCEQLCTQKRISLKPEYSFEEDPASKASFICTATLRDIRVQAVGTAKKKAKNLASKMMYDELLKIKEQDVPPRRSKSKDKLSAVDKMEETIQSPDMLSEEIQAELKLRLVEDHLDHKSCGSSEELLVKICSLSDNPVLNKLWPHRKLHFFADSTKLIELGNRENIINRQNENNTIERVFLIVRDGLTGQTLNVFLGAGENISNARGLAACRALSYIQAKFGIR